MVRDAEERLVAVKRALAAEGSVREIAKQFSVTPRTIRNWRRRFLDAGPEGLQDRSSAPKRVANKLQEDVVQLVEAEKVAHPELGVRRITGLMREVHGVRIGFKSVHRILQRGGLINASEPTPLAHHRVSYAAAAGAGAVAAVGDLDPDRSARRPGDRRA